MDKCSDVRSSSGSSSWGPSGSGDAAQSCDLGDECPSGYSLYTDYGYTCTCKRDEGSAAYCTLSTTGKGWQMDKCADVSSSCTNSDDCSWNERCFTSGGLTIMPS